MVVRKSYNMSFKWLRYNLFFTNSARPIFVVLRVFFQIKTCSYGHGKI